MQVVIDSDASAGCGAAQCQQFAVIWIRRTGEGHLDVLHGRNRAIFQFDAEWLRAGFAFFSQQTAADLAHRDSLINRFRCYAAWRINNFTGKSDFTAALVRCGVSNRCRSESNHGCQH
ncbi:hypothetical protein D3C71_1615140 [compost metagenome]